MQKQRLVAKKIRLSRETLRQLSTDHMERVAGGASAPCPTSFVCLTVTCIKPRSDCA